MLVLPWLSSDKDVQIEYAYTLTSEYKHFIKVEWRSTKQAVTFYQLLKGVKRDVKIL